MLTFALGSSVLFFVLAIGLGVLTFAQSRKLKRFSKIEDIEKHQSQISNERDSVKAEVSKLQSEIAKAKQVYQKYAEVVGAMKTAAEGKQLSAKFASQVQQLQQLVGPLEDLSKIQAKQQEVSAEVDSLKQLTGELNTVIEATNRLHELRLEIDNAKSELSKIQETGEMQSFGLYERTFEVGTPHSLVEKVEANFAEQKLLVKSETACICTTKWQVEGSEAKGRKMVTEQIKLMLRAFNGECDAGIAKIKHSNFDATINRIRKSFEAINKMGQTKQIYISDDYLKLKIEEATLSHQHEVAKETEKERQRDLKDQQRENERAEREIKSERLKAEKEELLKSQALENARRQLAEEHGKHNEKLETLIAKLETELKDAIDRKAKAISRAQLTKSGHVYVLSNLGTMGDSAYKIGMTRRLEPLERVKELGDASVPFPFDVHVLIYSENAPQLEHALHKRFADRRMNLCNARKEYFRLTLDEIRLAVKELAGEFTFRIDHEASQFRQSEEIRRQGLAGEVPVEESEELEEEEVS